MTRRILVVEDQEDNRRIIRDLLTSVGYEMIEALDGEEGGAIELDPKFFLEWPDGLRPHQVRLEGGDASSDSYCFP